METILNGFKYLIHSGDKRTESWPLVRTPIPALLILSVYLYFVKVLGPKWMANRKPYNIDKLLIMYNLAQIILNTYLFLRALPVIGNLSPTCTNLSSESNHVNMTFASLSYIYWMTKFLDLLDTVFFTLRKKQSQVSFLHIYHHTVMVMAIWIGVKYVPVGHGVFLGFVNVIVHIVMYSYYLLSVLNKEYNRSFWWKKHLTQLQLVQFVIIFMLFLPVSIDSECNFPKPIGYLILLQNIVMIYMFGDYYYKAHIKKIKKN